ncbi:MAG: hypothetical protein EA416_04905 [Trueperaceae bacterium]|nr:MAG: hypothetical protein EA416_04905 [Trueperaceae bacterium]
MLLRTLGGLALEGSALTRPKPLVVLAYLALEGPTPRRRLAEVLFGDAVDPRDSLSTALRHLRAAEAANTLAGDIVRCNVACDATALLNAFDGYRYAEVVAAYAGAFLDGCDVGLGVEAEEWLFETRETIASRVRAASVHEARAALHAQRYDDARRLAGRAIALAEAADIESDELAVLLAISEATEMPEAARLRAMASAMDVDALDVVALASTHDVGSGSLHRTTRLIGRTNELALLADKLTESDERVLVVFGLGGVGKTRLVARFAQSVPARHRNRFPDGAVFVPLDGVVDASGLVAAVTATIVLGGGQGRGIDGLVRALQAWRGVVVLDNVEQIEDVEAVIRRLTEGCPDLVVLASSRRRLALHAAYHIELTGLRTDERPGGSEATTLFLDRAARAGGPTAFSDADMVTIGRITRLLDGHPLAVELAAAMTRAFGVERIEAHLGEDLSVLESRAVDVPERHHTVSSLLEPTWQRLDESDRHALVRLATFASGFTLEAAKVVAALGPQRLLRLVDVAVVHVEGGGRGRYRLHPIVRGFVRERADEATWQQALTAHAAFVRSYLGDLDAALAVDRARAIERLSVDREEVRSAVAFALGEGDVQAAGAMLHTLVVSGDLLQARGADEHLIDLVTRVAQASLDHGERAVAERLFTKAANATRTFIGDAEAAIALYRRALAVAEETGDLVRQAGHHAILGMMVFDRDRAASDRALAKARALADAADDEMAAAEVLTRVAYCAGRVRDWVELEAIASALLARLDRIEAHPEADRSRVDAMRYSAMHNRAVAVDEQGDKRRAMGLRREALAFAEARGHLLWQGYAHADIARGLDEAGDAAAAAFHAASARELFVRLGARDELAALERDVGTVFGAQSAPGTGGGAPAVRS